MKKITLILLLLGSAFQHTFAQFSYDGSTEYGRLTNFVYDANVENKLYSTTYGKHIMVSYDNGQNWDVFYTLPVPLYTGSIEHLRLTKNNTALSFVEFYSLANPENKITVLDIATGNLISEFPMPSIGSPDILINDYDIFNEANLTSVVMLTKNSNLTTDRVYHTSDGGQNWNVIYDGAVEDQVFLTDVIIDPNNSQRILITRTGADMANGSGGTQIGGLMISDDSGQTWTETLADLRLQTVAINPSDSNDIYVGTPILWATEQEEALYRSLDGGTTWNTIDITWEDWGLGSLNWIQAIVHNPTNTNNIIVLEETQILISNDNGATWENNVYAGNPSQTILEYFNGDGVAFNPFDSNNVMIDNSKYPLVSTDGGTTTSILHSPFFEVTGNMNIIDVPGEEHLFYGVQFGYAHRNQTTDEETFSDIIDLGSQSVSGEFHVPMFMDSYIPGRVYTYGSGFMGNTINMSDDFNVSKNTIYSTFDQFFTAAKTDPNDNNIGWFATTNGYPSLRKLDFTVFQNPIVTDITLPGDPTDKAVTDIYIDSSNSDHVLMALSADLYETTDGGTSWNQITNGLEDLIAPYSIYTIVTNPVDVNQLTMATTNGVYTSIDGGSSWSKIYNFVINNIQHSTVTNGVIAGFENTNVYDEARIIYSNNFGATWNFIESTEFHNAVITSSAFKFFGNTIDAYLGSHDLGLLKTTIDLSTLSNTEFEENGSNIKVYPNPTNGIINISLSNNGTIENAALYNVAGQKLLEVYNTNKIDISNLASGMYLLKMKDAQNNSITKQIIKN